MMDLRSIYVANGAGIVLLLMLMFVSRSKILQHRLEDKIYLGMMAGILAGCICEAGSYTIDGVVFPGAISLNTLMNTVLFTINFLNSFFVMIYVDLGLYGDEKRILRCYRPQIVVAGILMAANVVNLFIPVNFSISAQNVYRREWFGNLHYFVILWYFGSALVVMHRFERAFGTRGFLDIRVFMFPILLGAGLQFMFYGLSLAWLSAAIGLTGLFMMQQNETAYIDSLAEIYNRQYLNHILSSWINRGMTFCGVMMDVDRFKNINDRFGHSEGDQAIRVVANILKRQCKNGEYAFRFAGDEFIVLKASDSEHALDEYLCGVLEKLEEFNRNHPPYSISLSFGCTLFKTGSVDDFLKDMDMRMYEMKAQHHMAG